MGSEAKGKNQVIKAVGAYEQSIRLNPNIKEAYNNVASLYFDLGMYLKAIDSYRKAVELDPSYGLAHFNLGMAYYAVRRFDEAIAAFEAARKEYPYLSDLLYFLARSYDHIGEHVTAINVFNELLIHDSEFYPAHFDIACVYMRAADDIGSMVDDNQTGIGFDFLFDIVRVDKAFGIKPNVVYLDAV